MKFRETIVDGGVEAAPQAFIDLLRGANTGKMVVRLTMRTSVNSRTVRVVGS